MFPKALTINLASLASHCCGSIWLHHHGFNNTAIASCLSREECGKWRGIAPFGGWLRGGPRFIIIGYLVSGSVSGDGGEESAETAENLRESLGECENRRVVGESRESLGEFGILYLGNCSTGTPSAFASFRRVER